ncbi:MAG TPA: type 1 glutamine amidotransferase family protein [Ktedonobacteraceae bacterium]|nr:type 1 glutamine amidotransferase family protein [Ktedonobacteraceae bacterium]
MEPQTVHFFVFDTLSDWEPTYAIAAINDPTFQAQPGRYRVKTVGVSAEPVKTIGGVTILPDLSLNELEPEQSAMLIMVGGAGWEKGEHREATEKAKQFLAAGVPVAAICAATIGLALAGILDERKHTGNAPQQLSATNYRGSAFYQNQLAVTDGNLITAAGQAPVDFAYHILKKLGVYTPQVLEAWFGLYKTNNAAYFYDFAKAAGFPVS